jgi:hypothetical protein
MWAAIRTSQGIVNTESQPLGPLLRFSHLLIAFVIKKMLTMVHKIWKNEKEATS